MVYVVLVSVLRQATFGYFCGHGLVTYTIHHEKPYIFTKNESETEAMTVQPTQPRTRPIIAITGSAGKSTTKEMTAAILSTRWHIFKSPWNLNFFTHTRRYAHQVTPRHQALVLEYGMSGPGHIRLHCKAIMPNIGVITNIGTAHIGQFGGDVRKLAAAKSELILFMKQNGLLIINADDKNSNLLLTRNFKGRIVKVGINHPTRYTASNVRYREGGMAFVAHTGNASFPVTIPIHGVHHVYNALMAIAVADSLGFTIQEVQRGLAHYHKMERRLWVHRTKKGITIIDDTYSANPNAVKASLDVLQHMGNGQKVAVLGTMLGMGTYSLHAHRDVGKYIAKSGIDLLYTYGREAGQIGQSAIAAGLSKDKVHQFIMRQPLHRHLIQRLQKGSTVLVKGSHAMDMKETAEFLLSFARK